MPNLTNLLTLRIGSLAVLLSTVLLSACGGGGGSGGGAAVSPSFPLGSTPSTVPEDLTTLTTLKEVQVNAATTASVVVGTGSFTPLPGVAPRIGIRTQAGDIQEVALQVSSLGIAQTFVRSTSLISEPVSGGFAFSWATGTRGSGVQQFEIDIITPELAKLQYHSFGIWGADLNTGTPEAALGYFTIGTPTLAGNVPTIGTASYSGILNAIYTAPGLFDDVTARASAVVNFAAGSIVFSTADSVRQPAVGPTTIVAAPTYNMSGTLTFAPGSNVITGPVTTGTGLTGTVTANFFGPTAQEIGGTFVLQNGGATTRMMGAFGVHQ